MTSPLRVALAISVGAVVTAALAYAGVVVVVLATLGIPLGAQPRPLTAGEYGILLAVAGAAAVIGGRTAARLASGSPGSAVLGLCAVLAVGVLWGFSGRNAWPDWWGPGVAVVMVVGAVIGGRLRRPRAPGDVPGTP